MEKDINILIVPDVHGRDFWREPVMENLDKDIVFLGDYLDPYPTEGVTKARAIEVFDEILGLRMDHSNITLLIGNHDAGYAIGTSICECRHDWLNAGAIAERFKDNLDLFDIAKEKSIGNRRFLFTHAGVHFKSWIKYNTYIFQKGFRSTAKNFNEMFHSDDPEIKKGLEYALGDVSFYRGGMEGFGSMIWADIREFIKSKDIDSTKRIQVVGHTMLKAPINIKNKLYCLDCQKVFYIDGNGNVRSYDTDEIVDETKMQ